MKPLKPIRRVSKSRQKRLVEYRRLKLEILRDRQYCEVCASYVPWDKKEIHHKFGRTSRLLCWKPGLLMVCEGCHRLIHDEPNWATLNGYLGPTGTWNDYERAVKHYEQTQPRPQNTTS